MIKGCKSLYLVNSLIFNVLCIGTWCNGNTTVFGAVVPGSNPGAPTRINGVIVQLARTPALQAGGPGFDPQWLHTFQSTKYENLPVYGKLIS